MVFKNYNYDTFNFLNNYARARGNKLLNNVKTDFLEVITCEDKRKNYLTCTREDIMTIKIFGRSQRAYTAD